MEQLLEAQAQAQHLALRGGTRQRVGCFLCSGQSPTRWDKAFFLVLVSSMPEGPRCTGGETMMLESLAALGVLDHDAG